MRVQCGLCRQAVYNWQSHTVISQLRRRCTLSTFYALNRVNFCNWAVCASQQILSQAAVLVQWLQCQTRDRESREFHFRPRRCHVTTFGKCWHLLFLIKRRNLLAVYKAGKVTASGWKETIVYRPHWTQSIVENLRRSIWDWSSLTI